ncbi:calcitonin gene-related peptide type 1 receptor-like isoform X2 [Stegodyphus dumicola]|nr:calcitonin gene-related peptide type 1 receptor-like isoform X2 [Stegodyphus dumicola]
MNILRDPRSNLSYYADPFNVSQELSNSFMEEYFFWKWKSCCVAAWRCCIHMTEKSPPPSEGSYCPSTWDGWQCWPDTPAGITANQPCQSYIYFQSSPPTCPKYAYKKCLTNGTWYKRFNLYEWTNYLKCGRRDEHRRFLYFHIATHAISIVSLIPALIIFLAYKQLQVHRIMMHRNLFLSLLLNGVMMILFKSIVMLDEFKRTDIYNGVLNRNQAGCKFLLILSRYFRMTNYMWMFCEGFYLHKLISAAFAEQKNLLIFYIIGWVFPIVPVGIYAILRGVFANEKCWALPAGVYEWIINGPNLLSLLVNLFFLCHIICILVTKLRATHANEPSQYRKAVRATLVLVPLFGLHFCLAIYRPESDKCGFKEAYAYFNYAMDGLQGFMVAVIFCYLNGEVIYLMKRTYQKYKLHHQFRGSMQNSAIMRRLSATQDSTMNDSQHNHNSHHRHKSGDHRLKEINNHARKAPSSV